MAISYCQLLAYTLKESTNSSLLLQTTVTPTIVMLLTSWNAKFYSPPCPAHIIPAKTDEYCSHCTCIHLGACPCEPFCWVLAFESSHYLLLALVAAVVCSMYTRHLCACPSPFSPVFFAMQTHKHSFASRGHPACLCFTLQRSAGTGLTARWFERS